MDTPDTDKLLGLRDRALLHIFFFVGARCSEPATLRVEDFGYDAEFPKLDFVIKGGRSHSIVINLECAKAIREYLDAAPHDFDNKAYLFQPIKIGNRKSDTPLSRKQLYNIFVKYCRLAGIESRSFTHMARATMITAAFEAGAAGEDIQRTVGHSSITTTEAYNQTSLKNRNSASLKLCY